MRTGADRSCMQWARAESNEAAAVFDALGELKLVEQAGSMPSSIGSGG